MGEDNAWSGEFWFAPLGKVICGKDVIEQRLRGELGRLGVGRPLVIASRTLATKMGVVDQLVKSLGVITSMVYTGNKAHSPRQAVLEAAALAREHRSDSIISIGGSSQVDTAKGVNLILSEGEDFDAHKVIFQYPDKRVVPELPHDKLPYIAITTTLSGSEFTHVIGITNESTGAKDIYLDPKVTARVVFLDPSITVHTPRELWASTGINGMDRCIERICSLRHNSFNDALCLHALSIFYKYLPSSIENPTDLYSRGQLQIASFLASYGGHNASADITGAFRHQLGARTGLPHGIASCILTPPVMSFNRPYAASRQALVASAIGIDTRGRSDEDAAIAAYEGIFNLVKSLGLPQRLRDFGVTESDIECVADEVMHDQYAMTNPRPIKSRDEVIGILKAAW